MINLNKESENSNKEIEAKDYNLSSPFNNILFKIFVTIVLVIGGIIFYYINHSVTSAIIETSTTIIDKNSNFCRIIDLVIFIILFILLFEIWNTGKKTELNNKVLKEIRENIVGATNTGTGCIVSVGLFLFLIFIYVILSTFCIKDTNLSEFVAYLFLGIFSLLFPVIQNLNFNKKWIDKIKIPKSYISSSFIYKGNQFEITSIENNLFKNCSNLKNVEISDSITKIGKNAFSGCTSLENLVIPDNVVNIGENAFENVPHIEYHGIATGAPWGAKSMN